jgi:Transglycosylase-like domain/Putative peptidoglycan binding domain
VPKTDLASHEPWLESQRRSRGRRFEAIRRLRRQRGRRAGVGVLLASLTLAAGGAVAADRTGGSSSGSGSGAAVRAAGSSVAALQRALGITADGIYGRQTRRAVRSFQRAHGLTVDGIAGPQTLGALGLSTGASAGESRRSTKTSGGNVLARIAQCESGGDPTAISASGRFRGKYQFTRSTWRSMGGTGDPAKASEAEQDQRALALYQARGTAPWPVCGARA